MSALRPRRRALFQAGAASFAALGLTACTLGNRDDSASDAARSPSLDATDADDTVVSDAVAAITSARAEVQAGLASAPELATALGALDALHAAQLTELSQDPATEAPSPAPSESGTDSSSTPQESDGATGGADAGAGTGAASVAARIREAEVALADELVEAAVSADSGALARTLAGLAAGVDQALLAFASATRASDRSGAAMSERSDTSALQSALAAEHAAVWLFALLAARVSASQNPDLHERLGQAYAAHRARRDTWEALLRDDGIEPAPAAPSYVEPEALDEATGIRAAALAAEQGVAGTYGYLVGSTTGQRRRTAITALRDAAVQVVTFGGTASTVGGATGA